MKAPLFAVLAFGAAAAFAQGPACPPAVSTPKAAFLCGTPLTVAAPTGVDIAFIQQNAAVFKSGRMAADAVQDFTARFNRVAASLGLNPDEKHQAVVRYMTGNQTAPQNPTTQQQLAQNEALLRDPKLSNEQRAVVERRVRALKAALGTLQDVSGPGGVVTATTGKGTKEPVDYKKLNAMGTAGPKTVRAGVVPPVGNSPEPSVSDFAATFVGNMGDYAYAKSDAMIAKRDKDPTNPNFARQEHAEIMQRLVDYNTSAYTPGKAKVVMDAAVGTAAVIAYNGPFGLAMGIYQGVSGNEAPGLGLAGHWVVALGDYVRGDKESARKHFRVGIADFQGDLDGARAQLADSLEAAAATGRKK